jgi:BatD DUF11 like domain
MSFRTLLLSLLFIAFGINGVFGQKIKIVLGPSKIGSNEIYTITLTAQDQSLDDYSNFPVIPGFSKAGTSSSSSMRSMNGQVTNESSIIQNYMPEKEGTFKLPPFAMKVNGNTVKSPGATIIVGPAIDKQANDPFGANPFAYDPFEDFFKKGKDLPEGKDDAMFNIQADKKEIWAGEGVNIIISFLVSEENQAAELMFYDIGNQLASIVKKIKPENCWEENFGIEEINARRVMVGKKSYTEYRIYQATLFPLVAKSFTIPSLKLNMLKSKSPASFFGAPAGEEIKPFYSKPVTITVKDLPDHPLKGNVSVGVYSLEEKLMKNQVNLNEGVAFEMGIKGEGNISYIQPPITTKSEMLDMYPPNTQQTIQRAGGRVTGQKTFSYLMVPKEKGNFQIRNAVYWVYFNSKLGQYDTLFPASIIRVVKGKSASAGASAKAEDSFYAWIEKADPSEIDLMPRKDISLFWINLAMTIMAAITLVVSLIRR